MSTIIRNDDGTLPAYAWPSGYPIYYVTADGGVLCPGCANSDGTTNDANADDKQWYIVGQGINYEDADLVCDHCECTVEAAYAD
jgi:hypothetical protein